MPDKRRDKVGPPSSCCMHDVATDTYRHYRVRAEAAQVGNAGTEEDAEMKCSIEGCRGEYEARKVMHTVRHQGEVIVFDHVPADVCSMCGDVLFAPDTVRRLEDMLRTGERPTGTVPLYEFV